MTGPLPPGHRCLSGRLCSLSLDIFLIQGHDNFSARNVRPKWHMDVEILGSRLMAYGLRSSITPRMAQPP